MTKVQDIFQTLCRTAPLELQMDFDNSGFLLGYGNAPVTKALLALDVTDAVIDEAIREKAELIISHHPLIFHPLRTITNNTPEGRRVLRLIENRIAVISMHTNLDIAEGGVNDVLMAALGVQTEAALDEDGCGRIGVLDAKLSMQEFLPRVKEALNCNGLRYVDAGKSVYRVAVMGGAGADSIDRAVALGCDTYVTADIKYHQFQRALDPVMSALFDMLRTRHADVRFLVSELHHPIIRFA